MINYMEFSIRPLKQMKRGCIYVQVAQWEQRDEVY